MSTEPSTLDPQAVNDRASRVVTDNVFETLLVRDANAAITPHLATGYERVDDTTWTFDLRAGVTFSDGTPFDAEAAAASINRIVDPDYTTQRTSYTEGIEAASVVDADTISISTDGPDPVLPAQLTSIPMVPLAASSPDFGQALVVGTGPYVVSAWNRGRSIQLARNDAYWGPAPELAGFEVRVVPDSQTALSALQTGEVDLVFDLLPEQAALAPKVSIVEAADFSYIAFNTYAPELADPRVRVAMNLAVDKETLAETVYDGHAVPNAAQHLTPQMLGYNPAVQAFPYDPDRARTLLAEAGFANGFDIELHVPIGRYSKGEETADYVAGQLQAVGIRATVVKHDWNEYRDLGRVKGTEPDAFDLKYGWNSNEWFDAGRIASHITCGGSSSKICDPVVDEAVDEASQTFDEAARVAAYQRMWAELHANPYSIYLLQQQYIYGTSARLDWQPRPDDTFFVATMSLGATA
ncbi:hypothetical protein BJF78_30320 [Pseudonocardia sp. CNS-139]|nr:hypothetical protein BJF78_30320 [Pseudonocardia sp. CNS-139]